MDPTRLPSGPSPSLESRSGPAPGSVGKFSEAEQRRSDQAEFAKTSSGTGVL